RARKHSEVGISMSGSSVDRFTALTNHWPGEPIHRGEVSPVGSLLTGRLKLEVRKELVLAFPRLFPVTPASLSPTGSPGISSGPGAGGAVAARDDDRASVPLLIRRLFCVNLGGLWP